MNLFNAPMHKIEDRRVLLQRVYDALVQDADARLNFRGNWVKLTTDETANWIAREHFAVALHALPPTIDSQVAAAKEAENLPEHSSEVEVPYSESA
jgi:hypothetical protein